MDKLIAGLRHFRENVFWEQKEAFERSTKGQHPLAMLAYDPHGQRFKPLLEMPTVHPVARSQGTKPRPRPVA